MRFLVLWFAGFLSAFAGERPRVLFVSIDGLGFQTLTEDPAARELKAERLQAHLDAMMATVSAGPPRKLAY